MTGGRGPRPWQPPARSAAGRLTGRLVAALVGLTSAALVLGAPALATFGGLNGKIAFGTNRGVAGDGEIFVVNQNGSGLTNLTNTPVEDAAPSWSADGSKIAFVRDIGGASQVFVMNADGSAQTNLTNSPPGVINSQPHWSPDGTKIAFSSDRAAGNLDIWVTDANGANPTRLTTAPGLDDQPTWSPDGTKIAFSRDGANIFVMSSSGGAETNLTGGVGSYNAQPNWSPDGAKIVFASDRAAGNLDIWVMDANGTNQTRLTTDSSVDDQPAFSPDGTLIIFVSDRTGSFVVFAMSTNGTGQTSLPSGGTGFQDTEPNWQPLPADLAISIVDTPDPTTVGQPLSYVAIVTNHGPATATGVTLTDTLPAGVTFVSASPSQGSCTGTSAITCTLGTLTVGATASVTIVVTPIQAGSLSNTASVSGSPTESNQTDNTATTTTAIQGACQPRPNVRVTTTAVGSGQLQATLVAQNNAATTANSLRSVRFTSIANVAVTLDGSPVTDGQIVSLPDGTQQATLLLGRHAPAQNPNLASTVAFAVTDSCGEWKSFVGGGPGAF